MLSKEKGITSELLAALGEGVYGVNSDGICTFINPRAPSIVGYERDEVIEKDQHTLFHHHKADQALYQAKAAGRNCVVALSVCTPSKATS